MTFAGLSQPRGPRQRHRLPQFAQRFAAAGSRRAGGSRSGRGRGPTADAKAPKRPPPRPRSAAARKRRPTSRCSTRSTPKRAGPSRAAATPPRSPSKDAARWSAPRPPPSPTISPSSRPSAAPRSRPCATSSTPRCPRVIVEGMGYGMIELGHPARGLSRHLQRPAARLCRARRAEEQQFALSELRLLRRRSAPSDSARPGRRGQEARHGQELHPLQARRRPRPRPDPARDRRGHPGRRSSPPTSAIKSAALTRAAGPAAHSSERMISATR